MNSPVELELKDAIAKLNEEKTTRISTFGHPCYDPTVHKPRKPTPPKPKEKPSKGE